MSRRVRAAIVGAGRRSWSAHFPAFKLLKDELEIAGLCDLDEARRTRAAEFFDLPDELSFADLDRMLAEVQPELVYAVMWPNFVRPVAERCFAAGAHVFLEKPPGCTLEDVEALIAAARAADRQGIVGFQRRHAHVTKEALRRIRERGPLTLCVAEFHKDLVKSGPPPYGVTTLWDDAVHAVDYARYLCGGEVTAVHAFVDRSFVDWPNGFNALIRFSTGATTVLTANRSAGARFMRFEAHGREITAYMDDFPATLRIVADDGAIQETVTAKDLAGSDVSQVYDGVLEMHRHILECVRTNTPGTSSLADALETMRLVARIEQGER
jgi:predicted dehydrogenase